MKLRTRRILYITAIVIFFLAAPPLILYTAGFRYDFTYNRIVETGSLVVRSDPEKANIYLDGKIHAQLTPTIINDILPGKINLLVAKDGYHSWEKTIEVYARVTTFEDAIRLYPEAMAQSLLDEEISSYWWNKKQDKVAYITNNSQLRLFNFLNKKDDLIANIKKDDLATFSWSPESDQFIFGRLNAGQTQYFVVDVRNQEKVIALHALLKRNIENVQWDPASANTIYALSDGMLYRIPYLLKTARLISRGPIYSYLAEKNRIILLSLDAQTNEYLVSWIAPSDASVIHLIPSVSATKYHELKNTNTHRIALYSQKDKELIIADPTVKSNNIDSGIITISGVEQFMFSQDGQTLVYTDRYGIFTRSFVAPLTIIPTRADRSQIIRYSQPIGEISWADDDFHVLYTVNNTLRVIDINSMPIPRSLVLAENTKANNVEFVLSLQSAIFVDKGSLLALPLRVKDDGSFFFGN